MRVNILHESQHIERNIANANIVIFILRSVGFEQRFIMDSFFFFHNGQLLIKLRRNVWERGMDVKVIAVSFFGVTTNGEKEIASAILVENMFHNRVHLKASITFIKEY